MDPEAGTSRPGEGANGGGRAGPLFRQVLGKRAPPAPKCRGRARILHACVLEVSKYTVPSAMNRDWAKPVVQALEIRSINAWERRRQPGQQPTTTRQGSGPGLLHDYRPIHPLPRYDVAIRHRILSPSSNIVVPLAEGYGSVPRSRMIAMDSARYNNNGLSRRRPSLLLRVTTITFVASVLCLSVRTR